MDALEVRESILPFIYGFLFLALAIGKTRFKGKVADTIRSRTATAPQGTVELEGFVWPSEESTIKFPTGYEAVYYSFKLEKKVIGPLGSYDSKEGWRTVFSRQIGKSFFLLDSKGLVAINTESLRIPGVNERYTHWGLVSAKKKKFIRSEIIDKQIVNFPPTETFFGIFETLYRIVEFELMVGSPIYACGVLSKGGSKQIFSDSAGMTFFHRQIFKNNPNSLKNIISLFDKDGDKKISQFEALSGYAKMAQIARRKSREENLKEIPFEVFGQFSETEQVPLLVEPSHEKNLLKNVNITIFLLYLLAIIYLSLATGVLLRILHR